MMKRFGSVVFGSFLKRFYRSTVPIVLFLRFSFSSVLNVIFPLFGVDIFKATCTIVNFSGVLLWW